MAHELSGVVVVDKPSGPTSFDVVRRVKGLFKAKRCGHTGTLDPTATGVLPICIGDATKIASFVSEGEKEYDAVVRLGEITDTQDAAGRTLETRPLGDLTEDRVREALSSFVGLVEQTPPMYSARKIDGKRLYELAREGVEVDRDARRVHIDEVRLIDPEGRVLAVAESDGVGTLKLLRVLVSGAHDLVGRNSEDE